MAIAKWIVVIFSCVFAEGFVNFESDLSVAPEDVLSLMQDELQNLRIDLTKSFAAEHTRKKRAALGHTYEATIPKEPELKTRITASRVSHASCVFQNEILVFESSGIYQVQDSKLHKLNDWALDEGHIILNTHVWGYVLFILTTNQVGGSSRLFTLQGDLKDSIPISRQQIQHQGFATAAQFFKQGSDFFVVIAVDNAAHSLTYSPILKWTGTYMDQMHEIQTRGASAVLAFDIEPFKYIVIAQSQDAAGNPLVGTVVVRMYLNGEVEKFQLLWSNEPVTLAHVKILKENFLVIGQRGEAANLHWFTGSDFITWQSLDDFTGEHLWMDTLILPDNEPLLLASNEKSVRFYSRQIGGSDLALNLTAIAYTAGTNEKIVDAQFLTRAVGSGEPYLALTTTRSNSAWTSELKIFPIQTNKIKIVESQVKDPENRLSACIEKLKTNLNDVEPLVQKFEVENDFIIRKDADVKYQGSIIVAHSSVGFPRENSEITSGLISPDFDSPADKYKHPPSEILAKTLRQTVEFDVNVKSKLNKILLKTTPGKITGNKVFTGHVGMDNLESNSKLELDTLNGQIWEDFESGMLKKRTKSTQVISGNWKIRTLETEHFNSGDRIGGIEIDNFLLQLNDELSKKQVLQGKFQFREDVFFKKGLALGPAATINGIPFLEIALKSRARTLDIHGYKHADFVVGGKEFEVRLLNGVNLKQWYESTLKTEGADQHVTGLKEFESLKVDDVSAANIKEHDWDQFTQSIVLSGVDQTIHGNLLFHKLTNVTVDTGLINGKLVKDFLTTSTAQVVKSDITVKGLKSSDLKTKTVNGINIEDAVLSSENAEFQGPIKFEKLTVTDVTVEDGITISSIDISKAANLPKTHTYRSKNGEPFIISSGSVTATELEASTLNGIKFEEIHAAFWRSDASNEILQDFDFSAAGEVEITNSFKTGTLNGLDLENDVVTTTKDGEKIHSNLDYRRIVFVEGDVECASGVTLNEFDISKVEPAIIRMKNEEPDARRVGGNKLFDGIVEAAGGIKIHRVNGFKLEDELVLLQSNHAQRVSGNKKFEHVEAERVHSKTNVLANGKVNGLDLNELAETTAYYDQPVTIQGNLFVGGDFEVRDLQINNALNERPIADILRNRIDLSLPQSLTIPLTIRAGQIIFKDNSHIQTINDIILTEYLPSIFNKHSDDRVIKGTKTFANLVVGKDLDGCREINGVDLLKLNEFAFSKTTNQIITGNFDFLEVHVDDNLLVEKIGGIKPSDLAQINEALNILSDVKFTGETTFENNIQLDGFLNRFKIEDVAEGLKSLHGLRSFNKVEIDGNMSWENSRPELRRLSHVSENSVTVDTEQTLTHKITITDELKTNIINSEKWINDVDLDAISKDAAFRDQPLVLSGQNTFKNPIVVEGDVKVKEELTADFMNGISIKELNRKVVRSDVAADSVVIGMKTFENGLSVKHLVVGGSIDNIRPADLVLVGDDRIIERMTVTDAKVKHNLTFVTLEGDQLKNILRQRISLSGVQRIFGEFEFKDDVEVEECSADPINGIEESDLFRADSEFLQRVSGRKSFQNLKIDGSVFETSINDIQLDKLSNQIYRLSHNEVFERHVVFVDTVLMSDINVTRGINKFNFEEAKAEFSTQIQEITDPIRARESTREEATSKIKQLEESLSSQAFWFDDYVIPEKYLLGVGPRSRVEHFIPTSEEFVRIALHERTLVSDIQDSDRKCDLPLECFCKSIHFVELREGKSVNVVQPSVLGENIFELQAPSGHAYRLTSQVISYNQTCTSNKGEGVTQIQRIREPGSGETAAKQIQAGYLTDAKIFSDAGKDYVVLAQFYDSEKETHGAGILIYEISVERATKIQTIPANGAWRLALEKVDNIWILVIANTMAGVSSESCDTSSTIYKWSSSPTTELSKPQFELIRKVETGEVKDVDVVILNVPKDGFGDSFIAFAGNEESGEEGRSLGKVTIYGYEKFPEPNYSLSQTLDFTSPVSALYAISVRTQSYLFVVTNSECQFFKYLHYEGFKKTGRIQIAGASDLNVINWQNRLIFAVASQESSLLGEAVLFGSPAEHLPEFARV